MKTIGSIALNVARQSAAEYRRRLITAHSAAEDYHAAMVRAMECQEDMEDDSMEPSERRDLERRHAEAVGNAAIAYARMPALWAMVTEQTL